MLVVDASAMHYALAETTFVARRLRRRLEGESVGIPELHDLEMLASVRGRLLAGKLGLEDAERVLARHAVLPLERFSHVALRSRIWELRDNLTAYDAAYVALAETLGAPLLTSDGRLARVPGVRCKVEVVSE